MGSQDGVGPCSPFLVVKYLDTPILGEYPRSKFTAPDPAGAACHRTGKGVSPGYWKPGECLPRGNITQFREYRELQQGLDKGKRFFFFRLTKVEAEASVQAPYPVGIEYLPFVTMSDTIA
jgi:hypothetical protein